MSQAATYTFTYDCDGNMASRNMGSSLTLTYDTDDHLTTVKNLAISQTTFTYDADGNRVKSDFSGTVTYYIGNYYEKTSAAETRYYYHGGRRVAMRVGTSTWHFLLTDHLGSTAITATSAGFKSAELRYKAWGETRHTWGTTPHPTALQASGKRVQSGCTFTTRVWLAPRPRRFRGGSEDWKKRAQPHPGRPARLTAKQRQKLQGVLLKGVAAADSPTDL